MTKKERQKCIYRINVLFPPAVNTTKGVYLIPIAVRHFLLNVHCQHLATEGQALGLLDHLLVRRHRVVAHHHMTLRNTFTKMYFSEGPTLKYHRSAGFGPCFQSYKINN